MVLTKRTKIRHKKITAVLMEPSTAPGAGHRPTSPCDLLAALTTRVGPRVGLDSRTTEETKNKSTRKRKRREGKDESPLGVKMEKQRRGGYHPTHALPTHSRRTHTPHTLTPHAHTTHTPTTLVRTTPTHTPNTHTTHTHTTLSPHTHTLPPHTHTTATPHTLAPVDLTHLVYSRTNSNPTWKLTGLKVVSRMYRPTS